MIAIRVHGDGYEGAARVAATLARAFGREGASARTVSARHPGRACVPGAVFVCVDREPVLPHGGLEKPDAVIVLDARLDACGDVMRGLRGGAWLVVNSAAAPAGCNAPVGVRVATCDAAASAPRLPDEPAAAARAAAMAGAFAAATGLVRLRSVIESVADAPPAERARLQDAVLAGFTHVVGFHADEACVAAPA